jgi:hypothetical protein
MTARASHVGARRAATVTAEWFSDNPVTHTLDRLGFAIFGQRDPDAAVIGWLPGAGSHGGGSGQVPPYVPYNPDWEPRNRIR